ncbi:transporter [Aquimarina rhabdastrellae]
MNIKYIFCCLYIFFISISIHAQYTEKINTNRPGTSIGAFSVGNNVLQFEAGLLYDKQKHNLLNTKTSGFELEYAARYGAFIEQLEVSLTGSFRTETVKFPRGGGEEKIRQTNFRVNTLGAKYLIYDPYKNPKKDSVNLNSWKAQHKFKWKTLIPAVSVYAGANFITSDNPFTFETDASISPKIVISAQNNWSVYSGNWVLVTNLIIDKITTDAPTYGWIITGTHTFNEKWAAFAEYHGQKSDFYSDDVFRVGGAYLFNDNIQLDANIATNFKDTPSRFNFSIGGAYRFDWHKKDEIIEQEGLESGIKKDEELEGNEENEGEEDEENKDTDENTEDDELEEGEEKEQKRAKNDFINQFENDSIRSNIDQELDAKRTELRLERERKEQEKVDKKEEKKRRKEEKKRLKQEAKDAKKAEKEARKEEKRKQKLIDEIDAELDAIEEKEGKKEEKTDQEIEAELDKLEKDSNAELESIDKELEALENEFLSEKEREKSTVDKAEEKRKKEAEKARKKAEKRKRKEEKARRKAEEKRRKAEEKRRKKEEKLKQKEQEEQGDDN